MHKLGKVGKRRLKVSRELTAEAKDMGRDFCEIAGILWLLGIDRSPCFGELQNCHSTKCSPRGSDQILDREIARGCSYHHGVMDSKTHAVQLRVVQMSINRREKTEIAEYLGEQG